MVDAHEQTLRDLEKADDPEYEPEPEFFDEGKYSRLLKRVEDCAGRGPATLQSVSETSDGFLVGWAVWDDGHEHSVFLGAIADFKEPRP